MINNHYADSIIAVAEAAKDNLTDTGVKKSKIKVILNGVDGLTPVSTDEKRIIKERFNLPDGYKAVSIVARLDKDLHKRSRLFYRGGGQTFAKRNKSKILYCRYRFI